IGLSPPAGDGLAQGLGPEPAPAGATRTMGGDALLLGSSFSLAGEAPGGGSLAFWGRGAASRFDGRQGGLAVDGEATGAMLGTDWRHGRWTAGLVLAHSLGEGGYRDGADEAARGTIEATLTGLYPWLRHKLGERLEAWGAAGYGRGGLTLDPADGPAVEADLALWMAAGGLRGTLLEPGGGLALTGRTDVMIAGASTAAAGSGVHRLAAVDGEATRLRLGLEGALPVDLGEGSLLTPGFELGARHDGGDAETGFGADIGASLAWTDAASGLAVELRARGLLAHEAAGFRERGLSGAVSWQPGTAGRGPRLSLAQSLGGGSSGGAGALLGRTTLEGLGGQGGGELRSRRLEARLGYGFAALGDRFTATPEAGLALSSAGRQYSIGWRLARRPGPGTAELALEARRSESANAPPTHHARARLTARF
ncbi:MAG: autotransporter outer membrane beta-barrel domain-containing protein, partial [Defluviicoccus sp.]|nr:autotransporter outer membrane beta-barrel domain-containing protein [Defluviicoccus sp.]